MAMPLVETKNLKKYFKTGAGMLHAVEDVNLKIMPGKTLGVVGRKRLPESPPWAEPFCGSNRQLPVRCCTTGKTF